MSSANDSEDICRFCKGTGAEPCDCYNCSGSGIADCTLCGGQGVILEASDAPWTRCPKCLGERKGSCATCNGSGSAERFCSMCHGSGRAASRENWQRPHPEAEMLLIEEIVERASAIPLDQWRPEKNWEDTWQYIDTRVGPVVVDSDVDITADDAGNIYLGGNLIETLSRERAFKAGRDKPVVFWTRQGEDDLAPLRWTRC